MEGNTESFIVRIWYEETDGEDGALVRRGSIEHVSSKRRIYFEDMKEMLEFIEDQNGEGVIRHIDTDVHCQSV